MNVLRSLNNGWVRAGVGVFGLAYIYQVDPTQSGGYPSCVTYSLTGYHCPGCGLLRATHNLLHGDVVAALHQNFIVTFAWGLALLLGGQWVLERATGVKWRIPTSWWRPSYAYAGLAFVIAFAVLRNLPQFSFIAPYT